ncbi:MAG: methyltransferase [Bacteroidota bacterium]
MPNTYFQFQQFRINQEQSGMKVTTDACLFGAWVANQIRQGTEPNQILDIGTGTGLLSLMLAQVTKNSHIEAVEINARAFVEAKDNFNDSNWKDRLISVQSSIQTYQTSEKYDLIICNPPFFKDSQKGKEKDKNQALHSDGLTKEDLLESVIQLLAKNGRFYLLYPEREMTEFISLAEAKGLHLEKSIIVRNRENQAIFRKMASFSFSELEVRSSEIVIRRKDGKYTDEFWELLNIFYQAYNDPRS